jgi:ABC-type branched-subunit amino acid transport system ATPase component
MLLEVNNLSKFGGMFFVRNISFAIKSGTITAIIGANGAGKTTLFNLLQGFLKQDGGTINYRGERIERLPPTKRAKIGIGRLWQDVRLFENLTVLENLLAAAKNHPGDSIWRNIFRPRQIRAVEEMNKETAEKILALIDLSEERHNLARQLSYGQQKLLALGRLLMNEADLLLLDEPLSGINPLMIDKILSFIRSLSAQGKTILLIEHNINKALSVADRVLVMSEGQMQPEKTPSEFLIQECATAEVSV